MWPSAVGIIPLPPPSAAKPQPRVHAYPAGRVRAAVWDPATDGIMQPWESYGKRKWGWQGDVCSLWGRAADLKVCMAPLPGTGQGLPVTNAPWRGTRCPQLSMEGQTTGVQLPETGWGNCTHKFRKNVLLAGSPTIISSIGFLKQLAPEKCFGIPLLFPPGVELPQAAHFPQRRPTSTVVPHVGAQWCPQLSHFFLCGSQV